MSSLQVSSKPFLQNIVKNLERQEVRDWLQNTREILEGEKKVENITHTKKQGIIKSKHMKHNFLYGSPTTLPLNFHPKQPISE